MENENNSDYSQDDRNTNDKQSPNQGSQFSENSELGSMGDGTSRFVPGDVEAEDNKTVAGGYEQADAGRNLNSEEDYEGSDDANLIPNSEDIEDDDSYNADDSERDATRAPGL